MGNTNGGDQTRRIERHLQQRILVLDGAMGTMVQALELDDTRTRGEIRRFSPEFRSQLLMRIRETESKIQSPTSAAGAPVTQAASAATRPGR